MSAIGIIGLGLMGRNLALHLHEAGIAVSAFSYDESERAAFERRELVCPDIGALVESLDSPRTILIMVTAGDAVDRVIDDLMPLLSPADTIMDGGNSFFRDTERRHRRLEGAGIAYLGIGISGGAEGARHGASLMVGGDANAFERARPLLEPLSARVADDRCIVHVGPAGAGHFVKMVHNGIEYGLMQLIAETWSFMDGLLGLSRQRQREIFRAWRGGPAASYLVEITADILGRQDDVGDGLLLDAISDRAGQKGTGRWTVEAALDLGVAVPTIEAAVWQRIVSSQDRVDTSIPESHVEDDGDWPLVLEQALMAAMMTAFIQGFEVIEAASDRHDWSTDLPEVARAWRGGCIVRAKLLEDFQHVPGRAALLADERLADKLAASSDALRMMISAATLNALPVPAFSASLAWLDARRAATLSTNLIQAQRDYFGAHGYERVDRPGTFSSDWRKK